MAVFEHEEEEEGPPQVPQQQPTSQNKQLTMIKHMIAAVMFLLIGMVLGWWIKSVSTS